MTVRLTARDLKLFTWIHSSGFVSIEHISTWLDVDRSTAYKRMKKLVEQDYLSYQRITYEGGIYYLNRLGVDAAQSPLPVLRKISLATYRHDLQVVSVCLQLVKQFGGRIVSERELRQQQGQEAFGDHTHISDGDWLIRDKRIALEIELNKKSRFRREKIFTHYLKHFEYDGVCYFYGNRKIQRQLEPYQQQVDWLKCYDLSGFIENPKSSRLDADVIG